MVVERVEAGRAEAAMAAAKAVEVAVVVVVMWWRVGVWFGVGWVVGWGSAMMCVVAMAMRAEEVKAEEAGGEGRAAEALLAEMD